MIESMKLIITEVTLVTKKARKQYPDRDERIVMANDKIEKLEKLNAERRELIEKTEAKLNERKAALAKSEEMLRKIYVRRDKLIAAKERPEAGSEAARVMKAAEKAQFEQLKALLKSKGMTMDDFISTLE